MIPDAVDENMSIGDVVRGKTAGFVERRSSMQRRQRLAEEVAAA
jgi:hypothetical protein